MDDTVFTARNLSKRYGRHTALTDFNMNVGRGDIYGFVGENGAGKTTLIRILAGFAAPTGGGTELFGISDPGLQHKLRQKIGGIVENPALYPDLSAAENLEICRLQRGIPGRHCISETLKTVNLTDTGKKKAKHFSLGMKQRLALAMSLLGNPEFLVLDEPVNGLDPVGIVEFRELLKKINRESGVTVLISSHILGELYQLATYYGFIHHGKMLEQLTVAELDAKCKMHLLLITDDTPKAAAVLEAVLNTKNFKVVSRNEIQIYDYLDRGGEVSTAMFQNGVTVKGLSAGGDDLEGYFMSLIGGADNGTVH